MLLAINYGLLLVCLFGNYASNNGFFILHNQKETKNLDFKIVNITLWLVPVITNIVNLSLYAYALGHKVKGSFMLSAFLGLFFIIFGNYLPKVSPNHVVGIRLPWTLNNTENWRKTHRFAGWIFLSAAFFCF